MTKMRPDSNYKTGSWLPIPLLCFFATTFVIYNFLPQAFYKPKPSIQVRRDKVTPKPRAVVQHQIYEELPDFARPLPSDLIKDRFFKKMIEVAECQIEGSCSRRLLRFDPCFYEGCGSIEVRLATLVSSFYLAYVTNRLLVISWSTPTNLRTVFNVNFDLYSQHSTKLTAEDFNEFVKSYPDEGVLEVNDNGWPSEAQWNDTEVISLDSYGLIFFEALSYNEDYKRILNDLFAIPNEPGKLLFHLIPETMVSTALRVLFSSPTQTTLNMIWNVWHDIYDEVAPPKNRPLMPGGRNFGKDGVVRMGIYAPFGNFSYQKNGKRVAAKCLAEGLYSMAVFHGLTNGITGVYVSSDTIEAEEFIANEIRNLTLPAYTMKNEQLLKVFGLESTDLNNIYELRSLIEFTLLTRMDILVIRESFMGKMASMVALNIPKLLQPNALQDPRDFKQTTDFYSKCHFDNSLWWGP